MVTPASLNGAGCATAVPAASVDASTKAANTVVFINASLSGLILPWSPANQRERYQLAGVGESSVESAADNAKAHFGRIMRGKGLSD
jgi:hypothetical protein